MWWYHSARVLTDWCFLCVRVCVCAVTQHLNGILTKVIIIWAEEINTSLVNLDCCLRSWLIIPVKSWDMTLPFEMLLLCVLWLECVASLPFKGVTTVILSSLSASLAFPIELFGVWCTVFSIGLPLRRFYKGSEVVFVFCQSVYQIQDPSFNFYICTPKWYVPDIWLK